METGATSTGATSAGANTTIQLLLRWDGKVVQWGSVDTEGVWEFGAREVRQLSMLPEVLRFLHGRYKSVNDIRYTRRFALNTMVPSVVIEGDVEMAKKWFKLHNATTETYQTRITHLEAVEGEPVIIEGLDDEWDNSVTDAFPQAVAKSQSAVMMELAVIRSRSLPGKWVVMVDAGNHGSDIVAAKDGAACYTGTTSSSHPESILYNIVNAMHRDGVLPEDVFVAVSGENTSGLKCELVKFFTEVEVDEDSEWSGLKKIAS